MSEKFKELNEKHTEFIEQQHIFFVGTAGNAGCVNISPKGMDSFRVINNSKVVWLNLTGSGNETAAHILENTRMTVMFSSFDKEPLILRIYGQARAIHPRDKEWADLSMLFPDFTGARQLFKLNIDLVQTSCGFAVPYYSFEEERATLTKWANKTGREGIEKYWEERNTTNIDGKDTGILKNT